MKFLQHRVYASVSADHSHKNVRLRIGEFQLIMSAGEARDLADKCHDAVDALQNGKPP